MMRYLGYAAGAMAGFMAWAIPQIHDWDVALALVYALMWIGLMLLGAQLIEERRNPAPPPRDVDHDERRRRIDKKAAEARAYRTMVLGASATVKPTVTGRVLDEHGRTVGYAYGDDVTRAYRNMHSDPLFDSPLRRRRPNPYHL